MSWNRQLYGEEHPSLLRKASIISFLAGVVCLALSIWIDFFPTREVIEFGRNMAAALTVPASISAYWYVYSKPSPQFIKFRPLKKLAALASAPIFFFFLFWGFFSQSLPSAYTKAFGDKHVVLLQDFQKKRSTSRRSCDYQLTSPLFDTGFPNHLCISKKAYETPYSEFILIGERSRLGVLFSGVHVPKTGTTIPGDVRSMINAVTPSKDS